MDAKGSIRRWLAVLAVAALMLGSLPAPALAATPIMGTQVLTVDELVGWYASTGAQPRLPAGVTVRQLAGHFLSEGAAERIRGDIAFAQSILETDYFRFTGQVQPDYNNYGGLGAIPGQDPCRFPTPQIGVRAQIQHLRAYADPTVTAGNLAYPLVDCRFDRVIPKGRSPYWEGLSGTWAADPDYAQKLLGIYAGIVAWADARRGSVPLSGDWNGDGVDTPGWYKDGLVLLRNANSDGSSDLAFTYGRAGDVPVTGDWDGDGDDTIGIVRGGDWHLRNVNAGGVADLTFRYGRPGDVPVTGDWNGDGRDTAGVFRGGSWYLRNSTTSGPGEVSFRYGRTGDVPLTGSWNGGPVDLPGIRRGGEWHLRLTFAGGQADRVFAFGRASDLPVVGDWRLSAADGDDDTPGVVRVTTWHLTDGLAGGQAERVFVYSR